MAVRACTSFDKPQPELRREKFDPPTESTALFLQDLCLVDVLKKSSIRHAESYSLNCSFVPSLQSPCSIVSYASYHFIIVSFYMDNEINQWCQ
jgi:hypothetical protein